MWKGLVLCLAHSRSSGNAPAPSFSCGKQGFALAPRLVTSSTFRVGACSHRHQAGFGAVHERGDKSHVFLAQDRVPVF